MKTVYIVQRGWYCEDWTILGVYGSLEAAQAGDGPWASAQAGDGPWASDQGPEPYWHNDPDGSKESEEYISITAWPILLGDT